MTEFAARLLAWFERNGRHELPWQHPRSPYRVWLSEIMLQQTQVATVIPYFERFVARFPDFEQLAAAPLDEVLSLWSGLGYYARARNLHRAAQQIVQNHASRFPDKIDQAQALPGIGRSTAGAILAQAYGQRHAILDGNVRRVLARHGGVEGWPGEPRIAARLWQEAEARLPHTRLADYSQAIMDLGATRCTARAPGCLLCPVSADCAARIAGRTHAIPAPRPRRERPRRTQRLLLIRNSQARLWLERRPPAGIWGGLWCPPILEPGDNAGPYGEPLDQVFAPIRHAFTHFDLELQLLGLRAVADRVRESGGEWLTIEDALRRGLPAPIRQCLLSLQNELSWHAPSNASSSAGKPKASTDRPTPARSAKSSSSRSPGKPGRTGSRTRRA